MVLDQLLRLRNGGSAPAIDSKTGEAGVTLADGRVATTGQAVVEINKTPIRGLAAVAVNDAVTATGTGAGTLTLTIEASDDPNFAEVDTVAVFPAITKDSEPNVVVRRFNTNKKYVRSVVIADGSTSENYITLSNLDVFIGDWIPEED